MKTTAIFALASAWIAIPQVSAIADPQDGQQACMTDALTVCSQFVPDRERVASCLISNRSRISPACRTALTHFKPTASSAKLTALR